MRLNGALKPHGAPDGCSIGAKKYRDKRSQRVNGGFNLTNTKSNCKYSKYFDSPDCNSNSSRSSLSSIEEITSISSSRESINIGNTTNNNSLNMKKQKIHTFFQNQLNNECSEQSQLKINKKLTNNQLQGTDNIQHSPSVISTNPTMEQESNESNSVRCSNSGGRKKSKRFSIKNHGGGGGDDCGDRDDNDNDIDNGKANGNGKGLRKLFNKMKRVQQSLYAGFGFSYSTLILCLFYVILLQPNNILCDEENNFFIKSFSLGQETTVPEFDYASRGKKKFGDKCDNTLECGFPGSICDPKKKSCQCTEDLPITNHFDKCGKEAAVNESCFFNEQCESFYFQTECRDNRCICRFELSPIYNKDGTFECQGRQEKRGPETYVDPAMIGVLVGMALMFVIICVVLRLFSQARWRENRTIFNTPNPRLMNVSLLRDSKLLHGQERRGSRMSVRAPSRQPSMASLRPHSPNPSLGSRGSSNGSATSVRSGRSNSALPGTIINPNTTSHERKHSAPHSHPHLPPHQHQHQHQHQHSAAHSAPHSHPHHQHNQHQQQQQPLITNITPNPVAESITVEIIEPDNK